MDFHFFSYCIGLAIGLTTGVFAGVKITIDSLKESEDSEEIND